jgi:hypothetical protein
MPNFGLTFERLLGIFIPGAIINIGIWYLFRPFIYEYFPQFGSVGDPNLKLLFLSIGSLCLGLLISHLSDIIIVVTTCDASNSEKSQRIHRRIARSLFRFFTFRPSGDPRKHAVERYLESNRKERFLEMAEEWANVKERELEEDIGNSIVLHQHLVARLRVHSDQSRAILNQKLENVNFMASLTLAVVTLFPLTVAAFFMTKFNVANARFFSLPVKTTTIIALVVYLASVTCCYALQRSLRSFCNEVATVALHYHLLTQSDAPK